jgi:SAM-dependent methyltransferase
MVVYRQDHAELYDLVFRSRGKSFEAEAEQLIGLVRERRPEATSLLDVACGTGAHLERIAKDFAHVEGVELEPAMRQVAGDRLPGVSVHAGDMRTFDLGRTFDAVICIGNAVACMLSEADLHAAVARMAAHLAPGGVLVAEPWWFPENFIDGYVGGHLRREDGRVVARITRSVRDGDTTRMEIKFVVADPDGFREWTDVLVTSLFTREQYEAAFAAAGCAVEFLEAQRLSDGRPNAPGLFVGVRS